MSYIENPKTKGSGIICAIPQTGKCPNNCQDCFFQSGRSYLEPLETNLPNLPTPEQAEGCVVRVNDGNDSNVDKDLVISSTACYRDRFFNTAIPQLDFPGPVVLTINPGKMTDYDFYQITDPPKNLMFVRFRTDYWNLDLCRIAVEWYTSRQVPIVLTWMAYHEINRIPTSLCDRSVYIERKRTLNTYWAVTTDAWHRAMFLFAENKLVYSCGRMEGERGDTHCSLCGNCLREYYATKMRLA